jgi:hypothetical protein
MGPATKLTNTYWSEQTDDQVTFWVSLKNRNKSYDLKNTHTHTQICTDIVVPWISTIF